MNDLMPIGEISNHLHGQSVEATGEEVIEVVNPADGSVLGTFRESSVADVDAAVLDAREAFEAWSTLTPAHRSDRLRAVADIMEDNLDELAQLEVRDAGKTWSASRHLEVPAMLDALRHMGALARVSVSLPAGDYAAGHTTYQRREPLGVAAAITPWNFPLWQAIFKIAPALAVGNTVVVKPAENTPLSTLRFVQLAAEALPAGVLNLVNGRGSTTGRALVDHPQVAVVSFTGSTTAGRAVAAAAAAGPKKLVLELGGNAPVIVFEDADVDAIASVLAGTALFNAGQECMAATRLIVHESIHDRLVAAVADQMTAMAVMGDTMDPATTLGPLISEVQRDRVHGLVSGVPSRAEVVLGGRPREGAGFFFEPTLVTGVEQADEIVQSEIFGPVATVQRFRDEAEAITLANGVEQGLSGSVWTRDIGRATRVVNALDFGNVWINSHMVGSAELPVGGFRGSGYGREGGLAGLDEFARMKQVTVAHG